MSARRIQADFSDRNVLVTGGSKGIGAAIARALAANGANVAVNYHTSADAARELVAEFRASGVEAAALQADLGEAKEAERLVGRAEKALGGAIDILVNNAGDVVRQSPVEDMDVALWDEVMRLNLTAAMVCSRGVIPGMKSSGWGRIVNISSISAHTGGGPGGSHYAASKAGMSSLTRSLAKELGPHRITANSVDPGIILTDIHRRFNTPEGLEQLKAMVPLGYLGLPEDVAGAVVFLASDSAAYITGSTMAVNGGLRMD
jgi:3-oxoacyl-[acyl-carrier protein] reductase